MSFDIDIGFASTAGVKDRNEDFCGALLPEAGQLGMGAIAAVADGVSAGGMGREAAQTTVISLLRDYYGTPETWDTTVALDRIIASQNAWLSGINRRRAPALGLTTLTALVLRGQSYALAHVGDSRAYLLREGQLQCLTQDHVHPHPDLAHQLLRAVGAQDTVVVDYVQGDLQVGDHFLLLTDGVHGALPARQLRALAEGGNAQAASQALVDAALQAGSQDNATALVVRVQGLAEARLQDEQRTARSLPVPPLLAEGDAFDGWVVTARVADNGVHCVYQVRPGPGRADADPQQRHALKTLHPRSAHDPEERAMLAHEAWLARRMQSSRVAPWLVRLHPPSDTAFYLLYDWHAGETLQAALDRQRRLPLAQVLAAGQQALHALGRLHRQGVVHRDIKPANLHQGEDGVLRLLDLGVALSGHEPPALRTLHAGTPSYVNPEQWGHGQADAAPQPADAQSDLFALGVTLYQLLTGRLPYGEVLPYQRGRYHRDPLPPSRHNPAVPIWLDHVLQKAVARDARQRFETAEAFALALQRGAARPLSAPTPTPLLQREPGAALKLALVLSALLNLLLVYWLVALPH